MRAKEHRLAATVALWLLAAISSGCGSPPSSNLSPTPEQAVDRHQQAIRYTEDRATKNQQAERKAMSRMARSLPKK